MLGVSRTERLTPLCHSHFHSGEISEKSVEISFGFCYNIEVSLCICARVKNCTGRSIHEERTLVLLRSFEQEGLT